MANITDFVNETAVQCASTVFLTVAHASLARSCQLKHIYVLQLYVFLDT